MVIYNTSAKDANSTIIKRRDWDLDFIVDIKEYVFYTDNLNEAYYLTSILNSSIPNMMMKDFQTKGLFGARDVHKKILDIYYPKFDREDETHLRLAELSRQAHDKAKQFLEAHPPKQELSPIFLGKLRKEIKNHLAEEILEIDKLVKKIIE